MDSLFTLPEAQKPPGGFLFGGALWMLGLIAADTGQIVLVQEFERYREYLGTGGKLVVKIERQ